MVNTKSFIIGTGTQDHTQGAHVHIHTLQDNIPCGNPRSESLGWRLQQMRGHRPLWLHQTKGAPGRGEGWYFWAPLPCPTPIFIVYNTSQHTVSFISFLLFAAHLLSVSLFYLAVVASYPGHSWTQGRCSEWFAEWMSEWFHSLKKYTGPGKHLAHVLHMVSPVPITNSL